MPQVRTIEVLRAARKLVANPETWTRGAFARRSRYTNFSIAAESSDAKCFCAAGAIYRAGHEAGLSEGELQPLFYALNKLARRETSAPGLIAANDDLGREAALSVIDAAISELVQRGEG